MNGPERLDLTQVLAALSAVAKAAPDLAPVHSCNGAELDIEVPDRDTARKLTPLLQGTRYVRATPLYETSLAGTIAGCPVRILVTVQRWQRGRAA